MVNHRCFAYIVLMEHMNIVNHSHSENNTNIDYGDTDRFLKATEWHLIRCLKRMYIRSSDDQIHRYLC